VGPDPPIVLTRPHPPCVRTGAQLHARGAAVNGPNQCANVKVEKFRGARKFPKADNYRAGVLLHGGQPRSLQATTEISPYGFTRLA
jgi:hypothetical protein